MQQDCLRRNCCLLTTLRVIFQCLYSKYLQLHAVVTFKRPVFSLLNEQICLYCSNRLRMRYIYYKCTKLQFIQVLTAKCSD